MSTDPREFEHPIDGTGGTVPPLVDVIVEVLDDTPYESLEDCARAVLAALGQAGSVEWATEHVAQGSRTIEIHPCDSEADAQGAIAYYGGRILSRITGPWTAVG